MLIWRLSQNGQRFYKGEDESDPDSSLGNLFIIRHDDGRETSRAAFEYDYGEYWRDLALARRAILEGKPKLDRGWQQSDREGFTKWTAESNKLVQAMNREDVKAAKSGEPPKYPVEVYPAGKRFNWFVNAEKYFEEMNCYSFTEGLRKRRYLNLLTAMDSIGWKIPNEHFRNEWVNRKPMAPDELLSAVISNLTAEHATVEEEKKAAYGSAKNRITAAVEHVERYANAYGSNARIDEALKYLVKAEKLLS